MKKVISMIMALAILALAAIAYAEENTQESTTDVIQQSGQTQSSPMTGGPNGGNRPAGQPPRMPGTNGQNQQQGQPPQMPSGNQNGNQQNGQPPQMPGTNGQNQQGQPPQLPAGNQNGNQQNGQPPQMPGTNGQNQQGQPPQMPSNNQDGNQQNGQPPELPGGEVPVMIDFDAMVTKGVISQATCNKIKAYMEEHKPADMPDSQPTTNAPEVAEEKPTEDQTTPGEPNSEKPTDAPEMSGGLLADLLKDGIITQAEYDALIAAQTAETT